MRLKEVIWNRVRRGTETLPRWCAFLYMAEILNRRKAGTSVASFAENQKRIIEQSSGSLAYLHELLPSCGRGWSLIKVRLPSGDTSSPLIVILQSFIRVGSQKRSYVYESICTGSHCHLVPRKTGVPIRVSGSRRIRRIRRIRPRIFELRNPVIGRIPNEKFNFCGVVSAL
jgi:hypothetical protein